MEPCPKSGDAGGARGPCSEVSRCVGGGNSGCVTTAAPQEKNISVLEMNGTNNLLLLRFNIHKNELL